ncbi:MAG: polysaccharide deacetylase family protein [Desulfuromonadaceae bacterium]|nr:polysaccharide deacetylase family protein [Desulfuromonadaceae bacterium]
MTLRIKRILGWLWRSFSRNVNRKVILIYHAVGSGPASLHSENFKYQMDWLAGNATVETLENLVSRPDLPGLRVALTFDDGYHSVYSVVSPVLEKLGFPATVYVNTGMIGEDAHRASNVDLGHYPQEEFLVWKELAELGKGSWTIGSHGVDHVDLTKLTEEDVTRQLQDSRAEIETRLGKECRNFCYTWGNNNRKVRDLVNEAGYLTAVAAIHGSLRTTTDRMALERIDVRRDYCLNDFIATIKGDWDYLAVIQRLRRIGQK